MTITARRFTALGITPDTPGFYDDPAFLQAETTDPALLHDYVRYVHDLQHSPEQLAHAEATVRSVATFLHERLVEDGRKGACVDMSLIMTRFLEREGVWSAAISGALRIETPLGETNFGPITVGQTSASAAHAWVSAPPFAVVDVTVRQQPYASEDFAALLPGTVLDHGASRGSPRGADFFDRDALFRFRQATGRLPSVNDACRIDSGIQRGLRDFTPVSVKAGDVTLTYIPIAGQFMDLPLETATNLRLSGKYPAELYRDYVEWKVTNR